MTYDRIKDLPEGALLWYGTDIGFLHWDYFDVPRFILNNKESWNMADWQGYRRATPEEYVLWKLEN